MRINVNREYGRLRFIKGAYLLYEVWFGEEVSLTSALEVSSKPCIRGMAALSEPGKIHSIKYARGAIRWRKVSMSIEWKGSFRLSNLALISGKLA